MLSFVYGCAWVWGGLLCFSESTETTCLQTSCSPGICQQPSAKFDNTPPCLCPEGTRYLWDRQVCAIVTESCGSPNPCAPGQCAPDGFSYTCQVRALFHLNFSSLHVQIRKEWFFLIFSFFVFFCLHLFLICNIFPYFAFFHIFIWFRVI